MNPAVEGYTAAIIAETTPVDRARLATDVTAVGTLFERNAGLRAVMTDVAVPPRARRAVLMDLLAPKVSPSAARLCAFAAGAVHAPEVPAAMSWLALRAYEAVHAESASVELLGHREARQRVGGYAAEVFEGLSVAELETVEDELFRFARIVASAPELRTMLSDRDEPTSLRRSIVSDLLIGKVHAATLRLADYTIVGGRARDVVGTLDWLVDQVATARGWRVARVRAGQEVDDEERRQLSASLSQLSGLPVQLEVSVDPLLLAGVDVEIGDLRLDATARGRLDRLRDHVLVGGWSDLGYGSARRSAARDEQAAGPPQVREGSQGSQVREGSQGSQVREGSPQVREGSQGSQGESRG